MPVPAESALSPFFLFGVELTLPSSSGFRLVLVGNGLEELVEASLACPVPYFF